MAYYFVRLKKANRASFKTDQKHKLKAGRAAEMMIVIVGPDLEKDQCVILTLSLISSITNWFRQDISALASKK